MKELKFLLDYFKQYFDFCGATDWEVGFRCELRQFEKCYQSKHLLKEDLRYLLSLIYGTMKIPR